MICARNWSWKRSSSCAASSRRMRRSGSPRSRGSNSARAFFRIDSNMILEWCAPPAGLGREARRRRAPLAHVAFALKHSVRRRRCFMRRSLLLLLSVLVCSPLLAERPAIPALTVNGDDGTIALDVTALKIRVTIRGHLARTEYELTYHNSLDRVTGGDFHFPLPADAEVSDIGLYFNGHLRHGVAVERV